MFYTLPALSETACQDGWTHVLNFAPLVSTVELWL